MGSHKVTVEGRGEFEVAAGAKLAYAIEQNGIDISHRCGGNARCTTCRVEFRSEEPPMKQKEHDCLEEDGVLGQFRLSCQIPVDRDMSVKVLKPVSECDWDNPGVDLEPDFS